MDIGSAIIFFFREFIYPFIAGTAVIWVPIILGRIGFGWWLEYVRKMKISEASWTMIEIKIPKEVTKSPAAFETVLHSLYGDTKPPFFTKGIKTSWLSIITDFGKWYDAVWIGKWPLWWSLEITSIEGSIYFFIRCEPKNREMIENLLYAQFPQAEITEVDDYTKYVPPFKADSDWDMRGCEYRLKETFSPDSNDKDKKVFLNALPLKTYVDYGLDDAFSLEENQKIDPLVPLLQTMGSIQQGEQIWIQYVIQGSWARFENPDPVKKKEKPFVTWQDVGQYYLDAVFLKPWKGVLIKAEPEVVVDGIVKKPGKDAVYNSGYKDVPDRDKPRLEAIDRKMVKPGYDCGIRVIYIAKKAVFKKGKLGEINNMFKQFNAPNLNSLEVINETDGGFDYPWQDYRDLKKITNREKMFKRYVKRDFFFPPEMGATVALKKALDKPLVNATIGSPEKTVLNTEELATLFHFPGSVAETSALTRIEAQKAEPPSNLPI